MFIFSQKLIEETIKVFREEDSIELSPETANEYLDSLGGLFLAFASKRSSVDSRRVAELSCVSLFLGENSAFPKPEAGPRLEVSLRLDNST